MTETKLAKWRLGPKLDPYLRITEPSTGPLTLWFTALSDGSMFPVPAELARRLGTALVEFADAADRGELRNPKD